MSIPTFKPDVPDIVLIDKPAEYATTCQQISIGNCVVFYDRNTKTISFMTSLDDEWSLIAAGKFQRILEYIEITYGS